MKEHFQALAGYNQWANGRLYDAAARLSDDEYRADRGAFFGSVHRTLNHLLVTDRIWLGRFVGRQVDYALDAVLFEMLPQLRAAREAEDERLIEYVEGLDEAGLAGVFRYRRASTPEMFEQELAPALAHLFNHQAHHRGQVHALLTGLGQESTVLDLLAYQRLNNLGGMRKLSD